MSFEEKIVNEYRAARCAERNRALRARLSSPRSLRELLSAMRALAPRTLQGRENRANYIENV